MMQLLFNVNEIHIYTKYASVLNQNHLILIIIIKRTLDKLDVFSFQISLHLKHIWSYLSYSVKVVRTWRYIENAFLCAVIRDRSPAHVAKMSVNLPWRSNALFRFSWCFYVWPVSRVCSVQGLSKIY